MERVRLNGIHLANIGPFTKLEINFPEDANLFLICGDNGIGKTTVLEAIVSSFSFGRQQRLKRRQAAQSGRVDLFYSVEGKKQSFNFQIKEFEPSATESIVGVRNHTKAIINIRASRDIVYSRKETISRDPVYDDNIHSQNINKGLEPNEIKSWFSNRYLLKPHSKTSGWTQQMLENLQTAEDFFSLLDPEVKLDRVDVKTFEIIVATPNGLIPFEYLSSGFRSAYILLLGIIKEIEFRNLNVSAKDFSGIVVIDEIDLHLHPSWQKEIGGALKAAFPKAQIIASTHSPHVIQSAQADEVIALVRDSAGAVTVRPLPSSTYGYAGWTVEEVLEEIMGVEDTKSPVFRNAMSNFDDALDRDSAEDVASALCVLTEMLHPKNPLRKLLEIQAAPVIGAVNANGGAK